MTIDCFHLIKRGVEALEELRLMYRHEAVKERKRQQATFRKKLKNHDDARRTYHERHPKRYGGKNRAASPGNGGTLVELHTRSRCLLSQSGGKWTVRQKDRAKILFEKYSKLCEAYGLVCRLRSIFRDKMLLREEAWTKLHEWYAKVAACTIR